MLLSAGCSEGGGSTATRPCPEAKSVSVTPSDACALARSPLAPLDPACHSICAGYGDRCLVSADYAKAYASFVPDAATIGDGGPSASCPDWTSNVTVECHVDCTGRRTEGIAEPDVTSARAIGQVFAARAYLEAVSVHAFARLERELRAHGAPAHLLRDVRRARRDEIRHTAMMARLARRFGAAPQAPKPLADDIPVRSLVAIACENAVEGCVRETYGAVVGMLEAATTGDRDVARAMAQIAIDECRHAELAWEVAAWAETRLDGPDHDAVHRARDQAVRALARDGDGRVVALLDARLWRAA